MTETMTRTTLHKSIILTASPEVVWEFLTEPDKLGLWFHAPKSPLRQGDALALFGAKSGDRVIWGEITAADPYTTLEYTFTVKLMPDSVSVVRWTLEEIEGGTRLSLEHEQLPQGAEGFQLALNLDKGWDEHLMQLRMAVHA